MFGTHGDGLFQPWALMLLVWVCTVLIVTSLLIESHWESDPHAIHPDIPEEEPGKEGEGNLFNPVTLEEKAAGSEGKDTDDEVTNFDDNTRKLPPLENTN
jgi:hypothetical protein